MKKRVLDVLNSPIFWGGLVSFGFYAAIQRSLLTDEFLIRYCAGHPVEYITVTMFFIGTASLFLKYRSLRRENRLLKLGPIFAPVRRGEDRDETTKVGEYIETVREAKQLRGNSLHCRRLSKGLAFLQNGGAVDELDQELRFLSEEDSLRAEADYGMVRMFIWAIPILGFLGTVIGITTALGNLNLTELETTGKLLADGLKIAFDTTALALSLVFVLYFSLFWVSAQESRLFERIDKIVEKELLGRFVSDAEFSENKELNAVGQMIRTTSLSFEQALNRQTELWSRFLSETSDRSCRLAQDASEVLGTVLLQSLQDQTRQYLQNVGRTQSELLTQTVSPIVQSFNEKSEQLLTLENQMNRQSAILLEVVRATGEIANLENRLNSNLNALSGIGCFEETLNSLTAVVQLLNTKLSANAVGAVPKFSLVGNAEVNESLLKKDATVVVPFATGVPIFPVRSTFDSDRSSSETVRPTLDSDRSSSETVRPILDFVRPASASVRPFLDSNRTSDVESATIEPVPATSIFNRQTTLMENSVPKRSETASENKKNKRGDRSKRNESPLKTPARNVEFKLTPAADFIQDSETRFQNATTADASESSRTERPTSPSEALDELERFSLSTDEKS